MREFEIGKMHIPTALSSVNLLWSSHCLPRDEAARATLAMLPRVRAVLQGRAQPSIALRPPPQRPLDLSGLFNAPLKADNWDLSGLGRGEFDSGGLALRLGEGAVLVRRPHQKGPEPQEVTIPVGANFAALVFFQSATSRGRPNVHAGDDTFFPNDASELIGIYEIVYADGLTACAEIRYDANVSVWSAGLRVLLYHARGIVAGTLPGGGDLVIWGNEWVNPRPDQPIASIRFRGSGGPSQAMPMLLGITGIEKTRLSDYR
jgi:hypothetical protein